MPMQYVKLLLVPSLASVFSVVDEMAWAVNCPRLTTDAKKLRVMVAEPLLTVIATANLPATVGVPLTVPLENDSPGGRLIPGCGVQLQVYPPAPPTTASDAE